jgi:hypothetical protein
LGTALILAGKVVLRDSGYRGQVSFFHEIGFFMIDGASSAR